MRWAIAAALALLAGFCTTSHASENPNPPSDETLPPPSARGVLDDEPMVSVVPLKSQQEPQRCLRCAETVPYCSNCVGCGNFTDDWPSERLWLKGDYILWWVAGNRLPPLVTSSPSGTTRSEAGVLGVGHPLAPLTNTTSIQFGSEKVDADVRFGGRITGGFWFDDCQRYGLEGTWFSLEDEVATRFPVGSASSPIVARPFFNVGILAQDSQLVAFPDVVDGQIAVTTGSEVQSGAIGVRRLAWVGEHGRIDFLLGYRFMRFDEELLIDEDLVSTNPGGVIPQGTTFDVFDRFDTQNLFHGADFGVSVEYRRGYAKLDATGKLGLGGLHRELDIAGATTVMPPDELPVTNVGGLLAQPTNIGVHDDTDFAIVPELNVNLQFSLTCDLKCSLGYSLILLTGVLRTGEQIDIAVDSTALPTASNTIGAGPGHPTVNLNDTNLWLQGLSFGVEIRR
jgi:hypothetical protein